MDKINFFAKFLKPYMEYEALTGFSENQLEQEIIDLEIKEGDTIANIGVNWGHSLQIIIEKYPAIKHIYGVDSSIMMLELTRIVFSEDGKFERKFINGLSQKAISFLKELHEKAKYNSQRITLIHSSAEELHNQNLTVDKIAATMGFHWLEEPQTKAFLSMNKCLPLDGRITFSTASARFDINNPEESFINNPYYRAFFEIFNKKYNKLSTNINKPKETEIKKYNLDYVNWIINKSGFELESHREHKIEINEDLIDDVCTAGIKFSHNIDYESPEIKRIIEETFDEIKSKYKYDEFPQRYESCPIFRVRKIREI